MDKDDFLQLIEYLNLWRNVNFSPFTFDNNKYVAHFQGSVSLSNGTTLELRILFPKRFPLDLPEFYIIQNDKFRVHVGPDGKICLFDMSSMLIRQELVDQILIDCFDQAVDILNVLPGTQQYTNEFCREFNAYWFSISKKKVYSCVSTDNVNYEKYSILFTSSVPVVAKTKTDAEEMAYNSLRMIHAETDFDRECLVIKLRRGSKMIPLNREYKWNLVRNYILKNVSSSIKRLFRKFIDRNVRKYTRYIFLIYPSEIGDILFGFQLEFNNNRYLKIANSAAAKVSPLYVKRVDYEYLTLRGGSYSYLKTKRVLLLGCGSVGGFLANNICQLGVLKVDILDKDIFMAENVHRHFLGLDALSGNATRYKADLMKTRLEAMYPYVEINALNYQDRTVEAFILNEDRLTEYDLIISALGEPTINLEINRILYERNLKVPFICCFNEPYGIGGHAVAVNIDHKSCLQCLYTDATSSEVVSFRGSLVAPNQNFKKNISGCSSAFVPYSCLDSQQTALLTARLALDVLNKKIDHNVFKTWLGPSDDLVSHGYSVSAYYDAHRKSTATSFFNFENGHCKTCGGID